MRTEDIRERYLEFFKKKDHRVFPSDTLVPDDPTVLFTSAGMNQFKPYFLGQKKDVKRAASCQKCLRTDDLEKIGKTAYHLTFFEMLGNFSFGDYFKKEAIEFAWEFITQQLNMKEADLWVSVYSNDDEAFSIWKDHVGLPENKIVRLQEDKNFWPANAPALGPNGPCGPCSEIFFDRGISTGCSNPGCNPSCDCGRFVETWNLVFTQFNRTGENKLEPLPQKNIDTGMGLERLASVLQGKSTNFEIDILQPPVTFVKELLRVKSSEAKVKGLVNAIVDHARAVTFAITDGVYPSNDDRGYVVRKIIRKALASADLLGSREPFLYRLAERFAQIMSKTYPELSDKQETVAEVIKQEEEKFIPTLEEVDIYVKAKKRIEAKELFYMYDTLGFPLEAISASAERHKTDLSFQGFDTLLKSQKELSRKKSKFDESIFKTSGLALKEVSDFIGYDYLESDTSIVKMLSQNEAREEFLTGELGLVILDKTPFYPEGGGQLTDRGVIKTDDGQFLVEEVYKIDEAIVHRGRVAQGRIIRGKARASVDKQRRFSLMRAHTATHLLQAALRKVLGAHVMQQGSLVDADKLRFDFTHFKGLTQEELSRTEDMVNDFILQADTVAKRSLSLEEARKEGALAFFKEKYKESVRMIVISDYSKELCAGTHIDNTSQIGTFLIVYESSISSGTRRIEAIVGGEAYEYLKRIRNNSEELATFIKCKTQDLNVSLKRIFGDFKKEKEKFASLEQEMMVHKASQILSEKKEIKGINFIAYVFKERNYPALLYLCDILKARQSSLFVFFVSSVENKDIFICSAHEDLVNSGIACDNFISRFKEELSLKGGGKKELVQGVLLKKDSSILQRVEDCFKKFLTELDRK